jgi:hypothetical protein
MKDRKNWVKALTFFIGLVIGSGGIGLLWFTIGGAQGGMTTPQPVTLVDAKALHQSYLTGNPFTLNGPLKSFTIDRLQYEAMKMIIDKNSSTTGFRLYFGRDLKGDYIVVIGLNNNGEVYTSTTMFNTVIGKGSPCPPLCDQNSQFN